jgi:integrase
MKRYDKEPVRIRTRKLKGGSESYYLDINDNGRRYYDFLKLYKVPDNAPNAKEKNAETLRSVRAIQAQIIIELANGRANIRNKKKGRLLLTSLIDMYGNECKGKSLKASAMGIKRHLIAFKGDKVQLNNIDTDFCRKFKAYLTNDAKKINGECLGAASQAAYFGVLNKALRLATAKDLIAFNPIDKMTDNEKKLPPKPDSMRSYLTATELAALIDNIGTESEGVKTWQSKKAFLFSCFCGLRISDINALRWENIIRENGHYYVRTRMVKTKEPIKVKLSDEALRWLPNRDGQKGCEKVFKNLCSRTYLGIMLERWAKDADIHKKITFHTARHTFATLLLTLGVDIYTVSKLLGHSDVKITEIYATLIDSKRDAAVDKVDGLFK